MVAASYEPRASSKQMLRKRTRLLFALSALAPVSVLIWRLHLAWVIREAKQRGEFPGWYDPGILFHALLFVGLGCFVLAVISLLVDALRSRS